MIHGHEVMRMMIDEGRTYTSATLVAAIVARYGAGARFYTCAAENMTAAELVEFLTARGKFSPRDEGFAMDEHKLCTH